MSLKGCTVVVTGSSRGIGAVTAVAFATVGARMVVNSCTDVSGGERVVDTICSGGGEAIYVQADVTDQDSVDALFTAAERRFGPVDVLVNNAGRTEASSFATSTPAHWRDMWQANLTPVVLCSQRAAPKMRRRGGSIINISSVRADVRGGRGHLAAYSPRRPRSTT